MISQTFVIVQAAYFIVNNSMLLRIFQGLSCQYLKGDLSQNVDSNWLEVQSSSSSFESMKILYDPVGQQV